MSQKLTLTFEKHDMMSDEFIWETSILNSANEVKKYGS